MADEYPEHEKLKALGGANQTVGDFIEWCGERGYELAYYPENRPNTLHPVMKSRDDLIAEFFEIDRDRLEREKRAMLEKLAG